jgi:probable phosphoglycerate mutase
MRTIYFVRHGESEANAAGVIAGSTNSPLTAKGVQQAHDEASMIAESDLRFDVIISSPLSRAHDTAKIIAEAIGYPVEAIVLIDELQEKAAGAFEGGTIEALYAASDDEIYRAGGEGFMDFAERVKRANTQIDHYAQGVTLVVGHAGIYRMAQVVYQGLTPAHMVDMEKVPNGKLMDYPL